jgi:Tfp pilus assembly protein PilO
VKRTTIAAIAVGGVVLVLLWYFVLFSPTSKDLDDTRDEVASVENQNQELENTIRRLKELSRNSPQQQATLRALQAAIPATPDLGEFILQANDIASEAGIDWLSIAPTPPTAGSGSGPESTISLSIQVDGGFFQVLDYLNRLEDLERLVLVDSVSVSTGGSESGTGSSGSVTGGDTTTGAGGAPTLSVTLSGRMFSGAAPTTDDEGQPIAPTPAPGSTTPTTPPASSSGSSS